MTPGGYRERLRCPWSWYLIGAIAGLVVAPEISFVTPLPIWSTGLLGVVLSTVIVAWIGRSHVEVREDALWVRGARLDARYVGAVIALDERTMRRLLGREGDPAAFLATKPWIGSGVQVQLDDPEDPVPYWAVSTRHPRELAAAISAARPALAPQPAAPPTTPPAGPRTDARPETPTQRQSREDT